VRRESRETEGGRGKVTKRETATHMHRNVQMERVSDRETQTDLFRDSERD